MTINTLLEKLNVVDNATAVQYMDDSFGPTPPFFEEQSWFIDVVMPNGSTEVAKILLHTGMFICPNFIHRDMKIASYEFTFKMYEPLQRIFLYNRLFTMEFEVVLN